ncbi:MAG: tetratricopeptide repeat protein [Desulfobacterales bacterium]|nr:tetratricopeptide repeat protein [Desulfobacterales bacterium]
MKNLICLFFAFLFLISCASKNTDVGSKKEIAIATQRVGEEYYNSGQYTAALRNLLEAYKTIPDDPWLNNSLGLVYLAKDRPDLAETHFKTALDLKPDYTQAKNNLGATYLKQKKWNLAIQCFEEISGNLLYATPEIPLSNLGWAYFHQKMFKKSKLYFNKSLKIRPGFLIAVHGLASIYIETGYYPHAIKFLHHALEKNPGAAILHSDLAKAYEALKEFNKAKKSWEVVQKLVPETSPLAREAEKRLFELN